MIVMVLHKSYVSMNTLSYNLEIRTVALTVTVGKPKLPLRKLGNILQT